MTVSRERAFHGYYPQMKREQSLALGVWILRCLLIRNLWFLFLELCTLGSLWIKDKSDLFSKEVMTYSYCFLKFSCKNCQFLEQDCWASVWSDKNPPSAIGPLSWKITELQCIKTIHKQKSIAQDSCSDRKVNKNYKDKFVLPLNALRTQNGMELNFYGDMWRGAFDDWE